jgi:transposase
LDTTEKKPRKTYTREFKIEAVRMTTEGGIKVARAARDLGLGRNTLYKWRREFRQWGAGPTAGREDLSLAEENRRLRKELEVTRKRIESPVHH